jgi:hypothetical protein
LGSEKNEKKEFGSSESGLFLDLHFYWAHEALNLFAIPILKFKKMWPMPLSFLSTHKQCILSHFINNSIAMFPLKPYTLAGFEPGCSRS